MDIYNITSKLGQNKVTLDINTNEFTELYEYIKDVNIFKRLFDIAGVYDKENKTDDIVLCFDSIRMPQNDIAPRDVGTCSKKNTYKDMIQFYIKENVLDRIDKLLVKYLRDIAINIGIDIRTVQGIASHSDLKMTSKYAKPVDKNGSEALRKFGNILNQSTNCG